MFLPDKDSDKGQQHYGTYKLKKIKITTSNWNPTGYIEEYIMKTMGKK
jgi:hypothetical protein